MEVEDASSSAQTSGPGSSPSPGGQTTGPSSRFQLNCGSPHGSGLSLIRSLMVPSGLAFLFYTNPVLTATLPIVFLPPAVSLVLRWQYGGGGQSGPPPIDRVDTKTLFWTSILTGTVGVVAVMVLQAVVTYGLAFLVLGPADIREYAQEAFRTEAALSTAGADVLERRAELAGRWRYWMFSFLFCFVGAGFTEEVLKYTAVVVATGSRWRTWSNGRDTNKAQSPDDTRLSQSHAYLHYIPLAIAASLGFSTAEGLLFVNSDVSRYRAGELGVSRLAITLLARTLIGPLGHALTATLLGANLASTTNTRTSGGALGGGVKSWWRGIWGAVSLPAFFHGLFNFVVISVSTWNGNIGWVHPQGRSLYMTITAGVSVQIALAMVVKRKLRTL